MSELTVALVAFIVSFGFIRTSARLMRSPRVPWWPGSVVSGSGVHLHHLVWGISAILIAGTTQLAVSDAGPWSEICAGVFGVGAGLTLDEFALWVYLDDVYWAREGRLSVDAVLLSAAIVTLVVAGVHPLDWIGLSGALTTLSHVTLAVVALGAAAACFLKGRIALGAIGLFLVPLAIFGALRLGRPDSPWARRHYGESERNRARRRFAPDRRGARLRRRAVELIGGAPSEA